MRQNLEQKKLVFKQEMYIIILDFCCVFLSQNGDPSLASINVYPHACLESLHETSRHAHYCGQSQLPRHYSRVREEAEGRENTSVSKISNSRFLVTRELYPRFQVPPSFPLLAVRKAGRGLRTRLRELTKSTESIQITLLSRRCVV